MSNDSLQIICDTIDQQISILKLLRDKKAQMHKQLRDNYNRRIADLEMARADLVRFYTDNL